MTKKTYKKIPKNQESQKLIDKETEKFLKFFGIIIFPILLNAIMSGQKFCPIIINSLIIISICLPIVIAIWIKERLSKTEKGVKYSNEEIHNLIKDILEEPIKERYPQSEIRLRKPESSESKNMKIYIELIENEFLDLEKEKQFWESIIPNIFRTQKKF